MIENDFIDISGREVAAKKGCGKYGDEQRILMFDIC